MRGIVLPLWVTQALLNTLGTTAMNNVLGIDLGRIYFREEIMELWGYSTESPEKSANRWFKRNFRDRGLRTFRVAGREAVHGCILGEWIAYNSTTKKSEY